jgi:hypothetical protein
MPGRRFTLKGPSKIELAHSCATCGPLTLSSVLSCFMGMEGLILALLFHGVLKRGLREIQRTAP